MSEHHHLPPPAADQEPDPRISSTLVVGTVGIIMTVLVIVVLEVLYYRTADDERARKDVAPVAQELDAVLAEQRRLLGGYRWVDEANGVVAVPIERAMELIVEENGSESTR